MNTYFDIEELKQDNVKDLSKIEGAGTLTTTNWGGIVAAVNSTGETAFIQEQWGKDSKAEILEKRIKHDEKGGYFEYQDSKYHLNEFMTIKRG